MTNKLYYGDNLAVLREQIADESVDLVYLDPPFNSKATYNVLFRAPSGEKSRAQIEAFDDTWHWNDQAEEAYWQVLNGPSADAAKMLRAMREFLGENDMMAYLTMMAVRLIELHRVLKTTGSLYLHCDPTASHFLRILLDATFGKTNFRSEIIWKRTSAHSGAKRWGPVHDTIFFYAKSDDNVWNPVYETYDKSYVEDFYRHKDDQGVFRLSDLTGAGRRAGESGQPWRGVDPAPKDRHWAIPLVMLTRMGLNGELDRMTTQEKLDFLDEEGLIYWPKEGGVPQVKRYLEQQPGMTIQDVITDIKPVSTHAKERLGYPTQKPVALLERIVSASSNEGDVVLDPFCGCGTTVHAAQKLGRKWTGIDVTHLAVALVERRVREAFGTRAAFTTYGVPKDLAGARALAEKDKFEFERWAVTLIPDAQPYKSKGGGDKGVDGILYFKLGKKQSGKAVISVKGGKTIKPSEIRDLKGTMEREKAAMGLFLTLAEPSRQMIAEAASAGFVDLTTGLGVKTFPKIQILTIEGLMNGERPSLPVIDSTVYKRAAKVDTSESNQGDLEL